VDTALRVPHHFPEFQRPTYVENAHFTGEMIEKAHEKRESRTTHPRRERVGIRIVRKTL
jgi:hypothetical protein